MEKKGVRKGAWTKDEDTLLKICVEKYGEGHWHKVPLRAGLNRCRKSCRLRWLNYVRPNLKRGCFTEDEVDLILRLHKLLGNRWSLIAGRLPGRTANDVKNFWTTHIAKKSRKKPISGVDNIVKPRPRTFSELPLTMMSEKAVAKEGNPNQNQTSQQEESNDWIKSVEASRSNNQTFPLSEEEVDECIQWWGRLLENTENGDGSFPFSGEDGGGPTVKGMISPALSDECGLDNI